MSISTLVDDSARVSRSTFLTQPSDIATASRPVQLEIVDPPEVPLVDGSAIGYANFDYAASAPCARAAADAVSRLLPSYTAVHRGSGWLSQQCTSAYESARETVARFVGCREDDEVIFTKHTTESLNLLAGALPTDTAVIAFESEHHANLLAWPNLIRLPTPDSPVTAVRSIVEALQVLGSETRVLIAITGASNVTGELFPVAEIAVAAHRFGARVVLDAAQLAPHREINIAELGVDYVAFSGHKMYAPFGCGVLAGRRDWLDSAQPHLAGGGATSWVGEATDAVSYKTGPARHEAGSPNVLGAVALAAVCRELEFYSWTELADREESLRARLSDGLSRISTVQQLHMFGPAAARVSTVAFTVDDVPADLLAAALSAEHGIGVRNGLFCAHPLTRRLITAAHNDRAPRSSTTVRSHASAAAPPVQAVRASFGLGSTAQDIDRLIAAVTRIATHGPQWQYIEVDGALVPHSDPRAEDAPAGQLTRAEPRF